MVEDPSDQAADRDTRDPGWGRVLMVSALWGWGIAHTLAYLRVFKDQLDIDLNVTSIANLPLLFPDTPNGNKLKDRMQGFAYLTLKPDLPKDEEALAKIPTEQRYNTATINSNSNMPFSVFGNAFLLERLEAVEGQTEKERLEKLAQGYKRAGQLHHLFCHWERMVSDLLTRQALESGGSGKVEGLAWSFFVNPSW